MVTAADEFNDTTPVGKSPKGFLSVNMLDRTCDKSKAERIASQLKKAGFVVGISTDTPEYKGEKTRYQVVYME